MAELTTENVSPRLRDIFNKGFVAMERDNLDYAIKMFRACIDQEPRFLNARKFLRAAEIKLAKSKPENALARILGQAASLPGIAKAMFQIKSNKPMDALTTVEDGLRNYPLNTQLIKLLDQAAVAADMPEVAIQTLEMAREYLPEDDKLVERLGLLYMKTAQHALGRQCFEILCELRPNNSRAVKLLKDAMAMDTISKEWSEAAGGGDYRKIIKDEKEAEILEMESKAVRDEADIAALITENIARVKREPQNINYRRALATLYLSNKMYDEAIKAIEEAQQVTSGRDPQLDNMISQVRLQKYDTDIATMRQAGSEADALQLEAKRTAFAFEDLNTRVMRYPNDLQLRYDLGILLHERKQVDEAIQQFQLAQRSPLLHTRSLFYLGLCFAAKKQYDIAVEQLEKAVAEMPGMDEQKKAAFYELGLAWEAMGDHPKSQDYFKQIYQSDIRYRDVSARIEKGYAGAQNR